MLDFLSGNMELILGVLLGVSELLSMIPGVKANGIFQALYNGLKKLAGK